MTGALTSESSWLRRAARKVNQGLGNLKEDLPSARGRFWCLRRNSRSKNMLLKKVKKEWAPGYCQNRGSRWLLGCCCQDPRHPICMDTAQRKDRRRPCFLLSSCCLLQHHLLAEFNISPVGKGEMHCRLQSLDSLPQRRTKKVGWERTNQWLAHFPMWSKCCTNQDGAWDFRCEERRLTLCWHLAFPAPTLLFSKYHSHSPHSPWRGCFCISLAIGLWFS